MDIPDNLEPFPRYKARDPTKYDPHSFTAAPDFVNDAMRIPDNFAPYPRYGYHVPDRVVPVKVTLPRDDVTEVTTAIDNKADDVTMVLDYNGTDSEWIFGKVEDTVILPMLLSLIALWCLVGNLLVIYSIIAHRHRRTGFNLMLLNISICDLIFILFTVPTAIFNHASFETSTQLPALEICKFVHYVTFVCVYVTMYTVVVTCVFRFCGEYMSDNGKSVSYLSRGNAMLSCVVIWAAFIVAHLNFLLEPNVAIFQEPFICVQSDALMEPTKLRTLWTTFLTCGFLLPLISIGLISAVTLRKYYRQEKTLSMRRPGFYEGMRLSSSTHADMEPERRKTVLIMTLMSVRTLCWIPVQIFVMVDAFGYSEVRRDSLFYRKAEMLSLCVAFIGACVNPLVYHCIYREMKTAFKETLIRLGCGACVTLGSEDESSDMNETIMSVISDSSNHINYSPV